MSVALPSPWVDRSIVKTVTSSVDAQEVLWRNNYVNINGWQLEARIRTDISTFPNDVEHYELWITGPFGAAVKIEDHSSPFTVPAPVPAAPTSGVWTFTLTAGPYRLGTRYKNDTGAVPSFGPRDYVEEEGWWADEATTIQITWGGQSLTTYVLTGSTTPPAAGATPTYQGGQIGKLFGAVGVELQHGGDPPTVMLRNFSLDGNGARTDELSTSVIRNNGGNGIDGFANGTDAFIVAPPYKIRDDIAVTQFGTAAADWAHVTDLLRCSSVHQNPARSFLTYPTDNGLFTALCDSWTVNALHVTATGPDPFLFSLAKVGYQVQQAWADGLDPALSASDKWVPVRGPQLTDPTLHTPYHPVTMNLAATVDAHRPGGATPSNWVALDANCTVTEHALTTDIAQTGASAGVRRTVNSAWRARAAAGGDGYRDLTRHAGEDIFWLSPFGFLKWTVNAPTASTLTLVIAYVDLEVATPGSPPYTEHPHTATFSLPLASGANTIYVDFLLAGGAETYVTRIDSWTLSGFTSGAGTYTIGGFGGQARSDLAAPGGQVGHKLAFGVPGSSDYSALTSSLDGSWLWQGVADLGNKADETGDWGGSARYVVPGGDQGLLADYWTSAGIVGLGGVEGLAVSYDSTASDAAIKDAYGVRLAPENADWVEPVVPLHRVAAGTDWKPDVSPCCRELWVANCQEYRAYVNHPLWGALESLVLSGGARAVGAAMHARRTDTGATAGATTSDLLGYAQATPVPANAVVDWELVQA